MNAAFRFVISYYIWQNKFINFVCVRQQPGWAERSWSVPGSVDEMLAAVLHAGEKLRRMMGKPTPCSKWGQLTGGHALKWTKDRVTLLGDSAHAMLATFGQGANMDFEDANMLARWLRANADDPHTALSGYEAVRKPRATRVPQFPFHNHWSLFSWWSLLRTIPFNARSCRICGHYRRHAIMRGYARKGWPLLWNSIRMGVSN